MHTRTILTALLCACSCAIAAGALAQTRLGIPVQQQNEQLRQEIERARREIERAAQEVGRLSAEMAGPITEQWTNEFMHRFQAVAGRSFLGVVVEDTELGARVTAVTPNGPAASAGVLVGDTIVAIDGVSLVPQPGQPSSANQTLLSQVAEVEPGEEVDLRVLRGGDYRDIEVTMRADDGQWFSYSTSPQFSFNTYGPPWIRLFGRSEPWSDFEFITLTAELGEYFGTNKGLLVVRAPDDNDLGFRDGDVILDIGGREPQSPEHALRILGSFEPGESLRVSIMRKQARQTLEIKIPGEQAADNV